MSDQYNHSLYDNSDYPSRQRSSRSGRQGRRPRKHRRRGVGRTILKVLGTLFLIGLCTGAILCCFAATYIKTVIVPLADLSLDDFQLGQNSVIYYEDRQTGEYEELVTLLNTTSSIWVDHEDIPQNLINAAVAIEDQHFWTHPGVDWTRTGKAVLDMFTGNKISGGSTITQQLIKNLTGNNETTVKRKVTEIVRALRFTQNTSKEDTITWYLNVIPLGSGCEGVGSAAYTYFGKPASELSLAECASLISITNNPSKYGPYSFSKIPTESTGELWTTRQWNKWRQELVLDQMLKQGYISQEEHDEAVAEELVFVRAEGQQKDQVIYSWYEETVISDVRKDLMAEYGWSDTYVDQLLAQGGLKIYSCVDPELQAIVENIYTNRANLNYTGASGDMMQSSITVLDNATGNVVAIAGQFGEKTGNLWTNYANDGNRQPGSSIKPLSVYAPALELDLVTPLTVLDDYPYDDRNEGGWPTNSGAAKYRGLTTVRSALTRSVNTIAVRILADIVTPQQSFNFVQDRFKLDLVEGRQVGKEVKSDIDISPLAMGGLTDGVNTRDMAEAYATFPNNGVYTYSRTYTKVLDSNDRVLLEKGAERETVIKDTTAHYINSILSDVLNTPAGTGYSGRLNDMTSAGKTGTTNDSKDRWFVGYTPYYTAAVWTGYRYGDRMGNIGNPSLVLWNKVMSEAHKGLENKSFPVLNGLTEVMTYCCDSGLLATEYCSMDPRGNRVASDSVFPEDAPTETCTLHTAESVVTVCLDCPVLDEEGNETGLYLRACAGCPANRRMNICLPNYEREPVSTAVAVDETFRLAYLQGLGDCTVHAGLFPDIFDPDASGEAGWDPWEDWNEIEDWMDLLPALPQIGDTSAGDLANSPGFLLP